MNNTPEAVAKELAKIYEEAFGGKNRGRFKISRSKLRRLSGRKRLEDSTLERIMSAAYSDQGLILVDIGDYFAVVEEKVMLSYRPVPESVLSEFVEGNNKSFAAGD